MKRTLDLKYDTLVIGADLSALCYSYIHKFPIAYLRIPKINPYQRFNGVPAVEKWQELMFFLSIHNLSPFANNLQSIRIIDQNQIRFITNQNYICNISYKNLIISDDYNISGMPISIKKTYDVNLVLDFFKTLDSKTKIYEDFCREDYFLKEFKFYNKMNSLKKDLVTFSYLSDEQTHSNEYSEIIAKINASRILEGFKFQHLKREIYELGKNFYEDLPNNIKILYDSPEEIMKNIPKEDKYLNYLESLIK